MRYIFLVLFLTGCSTPSVMLKNQSGQIVRCGGDSTGFMTGGLIGHSIQKENDAKCIKDYEAQGFAVMKEAEK